MHKVLVVAAHPDDELLGIGGILIKHALRGDEIRSVILCEGESLRYAKDVGQSKATADAARILGISQTYLPRFPDQRLDTFTLTRIISPLENINEEYQPDIIYCTNSEAFRHM